MRLNIGLVNAYFYPYTGGTEKHLYELGRRIARHENVHAFTALLDGTAPYEELEGMRIHRVRARLLKMPLIYPPPFPLARNARRELRELDAKVGFDILHLHGRWFPDFAYAIKYARRRRKASVVTLHNARPVGIDPVVTVLGTAFDTFVGIRVLERATRIIAVSHSVKEDIARYGIDRENITVIHNGVDVGVFKPSEPLFKARYPQFDTLLLFLGRLITQKGIPHLVEAMRTVVREHPRTGLLVVGKGKQKDWLQHRVRSLGLENNVVFPGFVDEALLPNLYSSADAYVLPSLWEVLPISLLEALACGVPLVASDAGGNPEIVEDGVNGFVFRKGDVSTLASRLNALIEDPALRRRMGAESRRLAIEKFDWEKIADRTLMFYRQLYRDFYGRPA